MEPTISVIVPIYNTKSYLQVCVDSVLRQTYHNFELILVNDGSTDGSAELCDEYQKMDQRIKVVHQKNAGVSVARNRGIACAKGAWIMFLDSDDWLELDALEEAYSKVNDDVDLVALAFFYEKEKSHAIEDREVRLFSMDKYKYDFLGKTRMNNTFCYPQEMNCDLRMTSQCAKLYRRQLIVENDVKFPEGIKANEDGFFNFLFISVCRSILFYNYKIYHCTLRPESASRNLMGKDELIVTALQYSDQLIKKHNIENEMRRYKMIDIVIKTSNIITIYASMVKLKQLSFFGGIRCCRNALSIPLIQEAIKQTPIEYMAGTKYKRTLWFMKTGMVEIVFLLYCVYYLANKQK